MVLLDRCAATGYQSRLDAALAAACVALAAAKECMPLDLSTLAAQLDRGTTLQVTGAEPEAALRSEAAEVAEALQGDTACLSGGVGQRGGRFTK